MVWNDVDFDSAKKDIISYYRGCITENELGDKICPNCKFVYREHAWWGVSCADINPLKCPKVMSGDIDL